MSQFSQVPDLVAQMAQRRLMSPQPTSAPVSTPNDPVASYIQQNFPQHQDPSRLRRILSDIAGAGMGALTLNPYIGEHLAHNISDQPNQEHLRRFMEGLQPLELQAKNAAGQQELAESRAKEFQERSAGQAALGKENYEESLPLSERLKLEHPVRPLAGKVFEGMNPQNQPTNYFEPGEGGNPQPLSPAIPKVQPLNFGQREQLINDRGKVEGQNIDKRQGYESGNIDKRFTDQKALAKYNAALRAHTYGVSPKEYGDAEKLAHKELAEDSMFKDLYLKGDAKTPGLSNGNYIIDPSKMNGLEYKAWQAAKEAKITAYIAKTKGGSALLKPDPDEEDDEEDDEENQDIEEVDASGNPVIK